MKLRTNIFLINLIFLTLVVLTMSKKGFVNEVYAWDDCPKGLVNDPYPGNCPRYVDTDENGICDHSEPAPGDRIDEVFPNPDSEKQVNNQTKDSIPNNTPAILAVTIPLSILIGYTGLKKYKANKNI